MKTLMLLLVLSLSWCALMAQGDTVRHEDEVGEIKLNPGFMKELEKAFDFTPREEPITPPDDLLTREQLHQWVGEPDTPRQQMGKVKFDSMYVALKLYLKDLYVLPAPQFEIFIPGITDGGFKKNLPRSSALATFDVNALGMYVRPKEIIKRKSRALCNSSKATMDKFFPIDGMALYTKRDSADAAAFRKE